MNLYHERLKSSFNKSDVFSSKKGRGHTQDNATPNFFTHPKSSISGLLNEVSFVFKFQVECSENQSNLFPLSECRADIFLP